MGILNITPDSFSDGGQYYAAAAAITRAKQMLEEGADIIDIGGESTRPGSESISESEELHRILPVITALKNELGEKITISVDTWKSGVAEKALQAGATIVNSLGGFLFDEKMAAIVANHNCKLVIYHTTARPKTMQQKVMADADTIKAISTFFEKQITFGISHRIKREQFILDPGIGFGKTLEQNMRIIKDLSAFQRFTLPILIGVSRKSHLNLLLQQQLQTQKTFSPDERLEASLAETAIAVLNGATIVRTHDVLQTKKFLSILDTFIKQ